MPSDPSDVTASLLEVPGEIARSYYKGIPSRPRLVRRSSTKPFFVPTGPEEFFPSKELMPVYGNHKIAAVWEPLSDEVVQQLNTLKVDWTTIDVVRIVTVGHPTGPVVLWIGVKADTLSGEDSCTVVFKCLALLHKYLLPDVEIEIRESSYFHLSSLLPAVKRSDATATLRRSLTPVLGLQIASEEDPSREGTAGLYLSDGDKGKTYLLTAKHVLFREEELKDDYVYKEGDPRRNVILLGTATCSKILESIDEEITNHEVRIEECESDISTSEMMLQGLDETSERRPRVQLKYDGFQRNRAQLEEGKHALHKLRNQIDTDWKNVEQRVIGHVVRSPPLALNVGTSGYTEDVAIIELDSSKFVKQFFQGNVIDLGVNSSNESFRAKMFPKAGGSGIGAGSSSESCSLLQNRFLALHGVIDEAEMKNPSTVDSKGEPCLFIVTQCGASGVKYGRANGIFSRVRNTFGKSKESSTEWCILPYNPDSARYDCFSQAGDSGSVFVDGYGRIGGLLTGGTEKTLSIDISYATPFAWLLPRIQAMGFSDMQPVLGTLTYGLQSVDDQE